MVQQLRCAVGVTNEAADKTRHRIWVRHANTSSKNNTKRPKLSSSEAFTPIVGRRNRKVPSYYLQASCTGVSTAIAAPATQIISRNRPLRAPSRFAVSIGKTWSP